jgi:hypothetical protein
MLAMAALLLREVSFRRVSKKLLSDSRYAITLHDLLIRELRRFLSLNANDFFKVQGKWSPEEVGEGSNAPAKSPLSVPPYTVVDLTLGLS